MTETRDTRTPDTKETSPLDQIDQLRTSPQPFNKLVQIAQIRHLMPRKEVAALRKELGGDDEKSDKALAKLITHCLPGCANELLELRGLGIEDREIVDTGLDAMEEAIIGWDPEADDCRPPVDCLSYVARICVAREMTGFIAKRYHVGLADLPLVRRYVQTMKRFETRAGRQIEDGDLHEIKLIICLGQHQSRDDDSTAVQKKDKAWLTMKSPTAKLLTRIHHAYIEHRDRDDLGEAGTYSTWDTLREAEKSALKDIMTELVEALPPALRQVVQMRFGLTGSEEMTLEQIGEHLGISKNAVRQLEAKALRILRHPVNSRRLRDFSYDDPIPPMSAPSIP